MGKASNDVRMADAGIRTSEAEQYTGRFLVLLDPDEMKAGMKALSSGAGISSFERVRGAETEHAVAIAKDGGSVVLEELGVAVVNADPDQRGALTAAVAKTPSLFAAEPERILHAYTTADYMIGYRDGVTDAVHRSSSQSTLAMPMAEFDETEATWGLQAIGVIGSRWTGKGVGVAVLDTGFSHNHPDFAGRVVQAETFVPKETADDGQGHGTHCIGTACGSSQTAGAPRYGVAPEALIHSGKVLDNAGFGAEGQILLGVNWAASVPVVRVISMSLGSRMAKGQPHSQVFERAARRVMEAGKLIIAAAGNDSRRPGQVAPVSHPANCPSVVAVGAIDREMAMASFSNGGLNGEGGEVDLVGPGVDILSARKGKGQVRFSGTSMATPHVAGVAALLWQRSPDASAADIKKELKELCQRLPLPASDVGAGLVRAPRD